jgi:trans-aconitate methyltransferase
MKHNWNAEDYAKNSQCQLQLGEELIEKLSLTGSESLLDIGCGDGKISAKLSKILKKGEVVGIDASENMINLASKEFSNDKFQNLTFYRMDAEEINFSKKFDIAFSNACLHWVKDHGGVLRKVHACLKPKSRILFQMGGRGNVYEVLNAVKLVINKSDWSKYFDNFVTPYYFYDIKDYEIWLSENNFKPLRLELTKKNIKHAGEESFKGWLRTTWFPFTDCLPETLRETFLDEVSESYKIDHPTDESGNINVKMVRLEVEAYVL